MSEALSGLPASSLFADTTASAGMAEAVGGRRRRWQKQALYHHSH